jgi:O-methyltransferase involved in polyketide biosynthesis
MLDIKNLLASGLQETLLIPLWCRAQAGCLGLDFTDEQAKIIIENLNYDFSQISEVFQQYGQICCLARAKNIDLAVNNYLKSHPQATVVNLGAGLDTTFSRVDNGLITWCDLDLPQVIEARKAIFPPGERLKLLAKSLMDFSWFEDVDFAAERGIFFVAGGVLHYFEQEKVKSLVQDMAEKFPGGSFFFDTTSPLGLKIANRLVKKSGNREAPMLFAAPSSKHLASWSPKASLGEMVPFFNGIKRHKTWLASTKMRMLIADCFSMLKYIRLDF